MKMRHTCRFKFLWQAKCMIADRWLFHPFVIWTCPSWQ